MKKHILRVRLAWRVLTQHKYSAMILLKVDRDLYIKLLGDRPGVVDMDFIGMPMPYVKKLLRDIGKEADDVGTQMDRIEFEIENGI
jgi:hypothetical protein